MKLVPISLLVVSLLVVAAVGIVRAAPGKAQAAQAPVARNVDPGKDDPNAAIDDPDQPMWGPGSGMGMWRGGMGMRHGGMGMQGPGMDARRSMGARLMGLEGRLLRGDGPLADQLELTGTQREKLRDMGRELARKVIRTRADLAVARLDFADALHNASPSRQATEERIDAIMRLESNLMKTAVTARLDAREILTPVQRKQLDELRSRAPGIRAGAAGAARGRAGAARGGRFWRP